MLATQSAPADPFRQPSQPVQPAYSSGIIEADAPAPTLNSDSSLVKQLQQDGFVVVKNVVSAEKAEGYVQAAHEWLEGFQLGYKRDDQSTWRVKNLPKHGKGGLYSLYSIAHAQFVWDLKTEPEYIRLFQEIWGTEKLLVSFDGAYLGVPLPKEEVEDENAPWPHTDQSPKRPEAFCIQSLMNLVSQLVSLYPVIKLILPWLPTTQLPNTEKDGGLWVMKGSSRLFPELIKAFGLEDKCLGRDHFKYTDEHVDWLKAHGAEIVHPDLGPGDVVFWDSRTAHWGAAPEQGRPRMAVYTCYKPAEGISSTQLALKQEAFRKGYVTSHDPITGIWKDKSDTPENKTFPFGKPVLSDAGLKAAGMVPY